MPNRRESAREAAPVEAVDDSVANNVGCMSENLNVCAPP
jgi:hypothetical protein